jgi:beta-phosphoglucomutase-like phosphatase (HAD superfamily)
MAEHGIRPGKPAPDTYLAVARNIGIAPSECVVVQDAVSGLAAAYAAGIGYIVAIGAPAAFQTLLACNGVAVAIKSLRDFPREQLLDVGGSIPQDRQIEQKPSPPAGEVVLTRRASRTND